MRLGTAGRSFACEANGLTNFKFSMEPVEDLNRNIVYIYIKDCVTT